MYCPHFHLENRDCNGICTACPYGCMPFAPFQEQFNYECPDCHGKFNEPSVIYYGETAFKKLCPFCGKVMKGL